MTTRKRLIDKWDAAVFGVKARVEREGYHRTINYIRITEKYSNEEKMLEIIECIEKHSKAVVQEAMSMNNKIQSA